MKGFVPTPCQTVDLMVGKLFGESPPGADATVLDPGCGDGEFIAGVIRYCSARGWQLPRIIGIELDPTRAATAASRFATCETVDIRTADFLRTVVGAFDYVIGNPPYVPITALSLSEREEYRAHFACARGRFDLYLLFFEQALRLLKADGRLVFITPEKFIYVETARPLRQLLQHRDVTELHFVAEATFGDLVTYPLISTVTATRAVGHSTRVIRRDGTQQDVALDTSSSWLPAVRGVASDLVGPTLADISVRISCGVATGADSVFVVADADLHAGLRPFAHPTIAGRQITSHASPRTRSSILAPYDRDGKLLPAKALGALGRYLNSPARRARLAERTCSARKPWYAFHDNLPLNEMLRPKLLCKDITERPYFVLDVAGDIVPRHSVYYIVPKNPADLVPLAEYLNSPAVENWLRSHCQRAANGFLRVQSHVLKQLPLDARFHTMAEVAQPDHVAAARLA